MRLLVDNTIESFPTVTTPHLTQFLKLITFLFWEENTAFEYNYLQSIFPLFHNLGP